MTLGPMKIFASSRGRPGLRGRRVIPWIVGGALGVLAAAVLIVGARGEDGPSQALPSADPGPVHVHALGVNPADNALFLATHTGLWRVPAGDRRPTRVGTSFQDTMGFTVVGPDKFLGSGHPDLRDDLPPLLGLIESTNAGREWSPISRLGQSDFHTLRVRGDMVYGIDGVTGRVFASSDRGRSWEMHKPPDPLIDLAVNPENPRHIVATGESGLYESRDAGRTWLELPGRIAGYLAWADDGQLYLLDGAGNLSVSTDRGHGRSWRTARAVGDEPEAFVAHQGTLYVALHHGVVKTSSDGGTTWTLRSRATD